MDLRHHVLRLGQGEPHMRPSSSPYMKRIGEHTKEATHKTMAHWTESPKQEEVNNGSTRLSLHKRKSERRRNRKNKYQTQCGIAELVTRTA
jgi:hypothetical protein